MEQVANIAIYNELKRRIIEMEYPPGFILVEKDLIAEFNVSRTPIREAILKLSQNGLVNLRPRIGTYVSQIDLSEVKYAYEVKKSLEGLASELASQRATEDEINELFDIIKRFETYDIVKDYKYCIQDDQKFHKIIRNASKNPILIETLEELNIKTARFLQSIQYVLDDYDWFFKSLIEIAEAIRDKDKEKAYKATAKHTEAFLELLSKNFFG